MTWVATHSDLMLSGLAPAACVPDALEIQSVDFAAGIWECVGHGFSGGESVRFVALPGNTLPAGTNRTTYYAVSPSSPPSPDFFTVPSLTVTDAGSGTFSLIENVYPKIDDIMAEWTSVLIGSAKAYRGQWVTPPGWAAMMVAKMAAPTVASVLRVPDSRYNIALIERNFAWAEARRVELDNGQPWDDGVGPIDATNTPGANDAGRASSRRSAGWELRRTL